MNQSKNKVYHKGIINGVENLRESTLGRAFTLVELIVVITILAILGTIAFISLQGYSRDARDSVRQSDIANINSSMTLFETQRGIYPEPTSGIDITFSGGQIWVQGTIGDSVITNLAQLDGKPVDPLTKVEYTYSRLNTKKEFEIATVMEGGVAQNTSIINQVVAAGMLVGTAYIKGDYNQMMAKVSTGGTTYVLAVPTIISGDVTLTDIVNIMQSGSLVYNGANNLPDSYKGTTFNTDGGGFDFNPGNIVAYTGTIDSMKDIDNQIIIIKNVKTIYTGTDSVSKDGDIAKVTSILDINNPSTDTKATISEVIKAKLNIDVEGGGTASITFKTVLDCAIQGTVIYGTIDGTDTGLSCDSDIVVCDGSGSGYTIAACNAGATTLYTNQTFTGAAALRDAGVNIWAGGLYQWGNNSDISYVSTLGTQIGATTDNSTYINPLFIIGYENWTSIQNDNLWGNNLGAGTNMQKKGPCINGYHVPSYNEWSGLVTAGDGAGKIWDITGTTIEGTSMKNTLKLPMAGDREWGLGNMEGQDINGSYWSISPDSDYSYVMRFEPNYIGPNNSNECSYGFSIRCFKN